MDEHMMTNEQSDKQMTDKQLIDGLKINKKGLKDIKKNKLTHG